MDITKLDAANAYRKALSGFQEAAGNGGGDGAGSSGFANMVEDSLNGLVEATQNAEVTTAKSLIGQADMVEVITAVANAEMTVETVVAVRDRMLTAYNEIIKMPV